MKYLIRVNFSDSVKKMQFLFVCFVIVSLVQLQAEVISVSDDDDFAKVVEGKF